MGVQLFKGTLHYRCALPGFVETVGHPGQYANATAGPAGLEVALRPQTVYLTMIDTRMGTKASATGRRLGEIGGEIGGEIEPGLVASGSLGATGIAAQAQRARPAARLLDGKGARRASDSRADRGTHRVPDVRR